MPGRVTIKVEGVKQLEAAMSELGVQAANRIAREHHKDWMRDARTPGFQPTTPTPGGYLVALLWNDFHTLAHRLGLYSGDLQRQLDPGQVREDHWPAILKTEKKAVRELEETESLRQKAKKLGISVVQTE